MSEIIEKRETRDNKVAFQNIIMRERYRLCERILLASRAVEIDEL